MKILLVTDNHSPTGGAENYFFELKKRLKAEPSLEVFSLGFGAKAEEGEDYAILPGAQSNYAKLIWRMCFHPQVYNQLKHRIAKFKPDIIHVHNIKQYSVSVLKAIKPYPVVQTIHDYGTICPVAYNIHRDFLPCETGFSLSCFWQHHVKHSKAVYLAMVYAFYRLNKHIRKTTNLYFTPSPQLVNYLEKKHFGPANYIAPFLPAPKSHSLAKIDSQHFFFAGNLGAHKGIYILLHEFALAIKQNAALRLTIAGKGAEEVAFKKKIQELGLEKHIKFLGWSSNLDDYYETCAAVIFPSLWLEAFGLIITDAMSHGRPIIGSNRGSPPWLIDDEQTGLIFDPLKTGDLAEKILRIAANPTLAYQLGLNGQKKLATFSNNEKVLATIIEKYEECIHLANRQT